MNKPKYLLHSTPEKNLDKIHQAGFLYKNGYPTVTGSLAFAVNHADRQGKKEKPDTRDDLRKILIMETPDDKIIAPGYKGVINIDEEKKEIHGQPRIWASAGMEAGIYDTKEIRKMTLPEKLHKLSKSGIREFARANNLDQDKILQQHIIATLSPSKEVYSIAWGIRKDIRMLRKIEVERYTDDLKKAIIKNNPTLDDIQINDLVVHLLESTIEQEAINFARNLFLMVKESQGYKIFKHDEQISIIGRHKESFDHLQAFKDQVNHKTDGRYDFDLTGKKELQGLNIYLRKAINKACKDLC